MAGERITGHALDVILKLEAEQLATALPTYFGVPMPPIAGPYPIELPQLDMHLERLDSVFELTDGSLLHMEFQSEHRDDTVMRIFLYDVALIRQEQRLVRTVVFYGPRVRAARDGFDFGAIRFQAVNIFLGQRDGEETFRRLNERVTRGDRLAERDRLDLVFLPLMKHRRPLKEMVTSALTLVRHLPEAQQPRATGTLLGLAYHYVGHDAFDRMLEDLMATSLLETVLGRSLQQGLEQGLQQGLQEGREQGRVLSKREDIVKVLESRFQVVPPALLERVGQLPDLPRLEEIFDRALIAESVDDVAGLLDDAPTTVGQPASAAPAE